MVERLDVRVSAWEGVERGARKWREGWKDTLTKIVPTPSFSFVGG